MKALILSLVVFSAPAFADCIQIVRDQGTLAGAVSVNDRLQTFGKVNECLRFLIPSAEQVAKDAAILKGCIQQDARFADEYFAAYQAGVASQIRLLAYPCGK